MRAPLLNERDIEFMLYEVFDTENLTRRERYSEHDRASFAAAIASARRVAEHHFLPARAICDRNQPVLDGDRVRLIPEIKAALDAAADAGLHLGGADYDSGGAQLPGVVCLVLGSYLTAAAGTLNGYHALSIANANLIEHFGTPEQIRQWAVPLREGRYFGTMALTEPEVGSGLADLRTRAVRADDGSYRISGNKIFISGGDHELSENIVHLVLARVEGAPQGSRGISLFIVPKYLPDQTGGRGDRNEVRLAGLFHKMGGRAQTSTALSFDSAVGYLVGEENQGLRCMFHMMNEARVMVGVSGAALALAGFQYSLAYARERRQGRPPSRKGAGGTPVAIIEHPDVRRMLLAQKCYAEGAFALCLLGSQLADDARTAPSAHRRERSAGLLDFLTPVIKTWPSEYGTRANDLAIQVLGGHGYINEHPVEMFYRDNRLNPIHEGTTGIQSLDLLGRKLPQHRTDGYRVLVEEIDQTIDEGRKQDALLPHANQLENALAELEGVSAQLLGILDAGDLESALANSVLYLRSVGHLTVSWLWLSQGLSALAALGEEPAAADRDFYHGKLQALRYFYRYELPKVNLWTQLLKDGDDTCMAMQPEWF